MRAHQIMTRRVITVGPDTAIVDAANTMLKQHLSGLPVTNAAGKLIGIVSEGDFIRRRNRYTAQEGAMVKIPARCRQGRGGLRSRARS